MSKQHLSIQIVSDVVCPWCVIGYKRLEAALKAFESELIPEITWLPFELNPSMPAGGENLRSHLAAKYGTTLEGSIAARKRLTDIGAALGFTFNYFDEMRMYNTHKAHKLLHKFRDSGHQTELKIAMFKAFFEQAKAIDDDEVLLQLVRDVDLDAEEANAALSDTELDSQLTDIQYQWRAQGVQAVPTFFFANKFLVSGAQESEIFRKVLRDLLKSTSRATFSQSA